jgi:hypothetical protein
MVGYAIHHSSPKGLNRRHQTVVGHAKLSRPAVAAPGCHSPLALVLLLTQADSTAFHNQNKKNIVRVIVLDETLFNGSSKASSRKHLTTLRLMTSNLAEEGLLEVTVYLYARDAIPGDVGELVNAHAPPFIKSQACDIAESNACL